MISEFISSRNIMVDYQKEQRYASFLADIKNWQDASFLARLKGNYPSFWHSFRQRPCPPCGKTQSADRLNHHIDWPLVEHYIRDYQVPISPLVIQTPLEQHLNSRKQVNLETDHSSISCSLIFILQIIQTSEESLSFSRSGGKIFYPGIMTLSPHTQFLRQNLFIMINTQFNSSYWSILGFIVAFAIFIPQKLSPDPTIIDV